jgi:hypothetical protein
MKKVWTAVLVVSLANLLALTGFAAWLVQSDRLDMDRLRRARLVLAKTITQEKEEEDAAKAKAQEEEKALAAAKLAATLPLTATERLAARVEATELDNQRAERLKREVLDMQRQLGEEREKLAGERKQLDADRKAFDEMAAAMTASTTDAQFQKTLNVMESLKPAQAVAMLREMMGDGSFAQIPDANGAPQGPVAGGTGAVAAPTGKNMSRAVSYLDAMDEKHRGAVMKELIKTDPKLAADLLERLRKQGEFARVP